MRRIFAVMLLFGILLFAETVGAEPTGNVPVVSYRAHVSKKGWMEQVSDGKMAGTTGLGLGMEAIEISVDGQEDLGIAYSTYTSATDWSEETSNGEMAGTTGKKRAIEAIRIALTGEQKDAYTLYYRVHVAKLGWLDWAKDGAEAGTQGYGYEIQAIEIVLQPQEGEALGSTDTPIRRLPLLTQEMHVSKKGWMQSATGTRLTGGTTGLGLGMEALRLSVTGWEDLGVTYSVHISKKGWLSECSDGEMAGTTGQKLAIQAIKIRLTGAEAEKYDIYYRAHVHKLGWMDWAKNGEIAGTTGHAWEMQALELCVVEKGAAAPGTQKTPYREKPLAVYRTYVRSMGWTTEATDGNMAGTTGQKLPVESLKVKVDKCSDLGISYSTYLNDVGWQMTVSNDTASGVADQGRVIGAVKLSLTGAMANYYNVWYRVHCDKLGWLGWTGNGNPAGTMKMGYAVQAVQIVISPIGAAAPGSTKDAYVVKEDSFLWPCTGHTYISSYFGYRNAPTAGASSYHKGIDIPAPTGTAVLASKDGMVVETGYNSSRGNYVIIDHGNGVQTLYLHLSSYSVGSGTKVTRGQRIASVGSTGVSTGPHLHFSVCVNGNYENPLNYVKR